VHLRSARQHVVEQPSAFVRWCRRRETGSVAFARICGKRELWHQQQTASHGAQAQVHLAIGVREDAIVQQSFQQAIGGGFAVATLGADKYQQPGANRTDGQMVDVDLGSRNALKEADQDRM